jgi:predicted  nucleic acid-binding Zn-ribbon protein
MKKKLFVVDTDEAFQTRVKSLCPVDDVEVRVFVSSMEILSLLAKEKPQLVFLDIGIEDLDDFVMHDLLKKAGVNLAIPVIVTYSEKTEIELKQYEKLQYKAEGYFKKPLSDEQLQQLFSKYLDSAEGDPEPPLPEVEDDILEDDEFSEEHLDRLVRGDFVFGGKKDEKESTNPYDDIESETKQGPEGASKLDDFLDGDLSLEKQLEASFEESPVLGPEVPTPGAGSPESQLKALKKQNESLQTENKKLNDELVKLNGNVKQVEAENAEIQKKMEELTNRLNDKDRETAALKSEFEKDLKRRSDELLQQTEERLQAEVKQKEDQLNRDFLQIKEKSTKMEDELRREVEKLKELQSGLESERDEIRTRHDSLNRTVSTLTEEKAALSEKITALEEQLANLQKELEETHALADHFKTKVESMAELLQKALSFLLEEEPGS